MKLNKNFFIFPSDEGFVLINYETKESYLMTSENFKQLVSPDVEFNKEFIDVQIIKGSEKRPQLIKDGEWPFNPVSKFFHTLSSLREFELGEEVTYDEFWTKYIEVCEEAIKAGEEFPLPESLEVIALPEHRKIQADFYSMLKKGRTIREFFGDSVSLQELADILFITFGKFHESFNEPLLDIESNYSWRRSSPSAGALHPINPYIFVFNVESLKPGVYYYDSKSHNLHFIKPGNFEKDLVRVTLNQEFFVGSAFGILTVCNYKLISFKYAVSKSYLIPYMENGHLTEVAILTATALGLKYWLTMAICTDYFMNLLNLKGYEAPLSLTFIGHGYDASLGPKIRSMLEKD